MADPGTPDADPFRSPWLLSAESSLLLVIDLQEKLLPAMRDTGLLLDRVERLLDGAALFDVPVIGTEQYPRGLGGTVASIAAKLGAPFEKLAFSGCGAAGLSAELARRGRSQIVLCGIETHVCVQQTALDLIAAGYDVHVPVDALSSRRELDHRIALDRMDRCGATMTTVEAVLFEWCGAAGTDRFKQLSAIVRRADPPTSS